MTFVRFDDDLDDERIPLDTRDAFVKLCKVTFEKEG